MNHAKSLEKATNLHILQQNIGPRLGKVHLTARILQNLENPWKKQRFRMSVNKKTTAAAGLTARAVPGRRVEKRESQRYHEWEPRSQQRAQCAPTAATALDRKKPTGFYLYMGHQT